MTPGQRYRLATIRADLAVLMDDLRDLRTATPPGERGAVRAALRRLDSADKSLRLAPAEFDRREGADNGR